MKKFAKYLGVLLREYFTHPAIYAAVLLFAMLCALGPVVNINDSDYSVLELLLKRDEMRDNWQCASYILTLNFNSSPWFTLGAAVISALPALVIFAQNSGLARRQILVRVSKRSYSVGLFASAFLTGAFIALAGIAIYAVIVGAAFPKIAGFADEAEFVELIYGRTSTRIITLAKKLANCAVVCGIFPPVTLIIYQILRDKFLAMTLPMMIQYVSLKASIMFGNWRYSDERLFDNKLLDFANIIFPSSCMISYYYFEQTLHIPFALFFAAAGIILCGLYYLFDKLNRKSIGEGV